MRYFVKLNIIEENFKRNLLKGNTHTKKEGDRKKCKGSFFKKNKVIK